MTLQKRKDNMSSANLKKKRIRYNYGICIDCDKPVRDKSTKRCANCFDLYRRSPIELARKCRACQQVLPIEKFKKRKDRGTYRHICYKCELAKLKEWTESKAGREAKRKYLKSDKYKAFRRNYEASETRRKHRRASASRLRKQPHYRIKSKLYNAKRRARLLEAEGNFEKGDWIQVLNEQENKCHYCEDEFTKEILPTIDHKTPLSRGGSHNPSNIVAACRSCNSKKGTKTYEEFIQIV